MGHQVMAVQLEKYCYYGRLVQLLRLLESQANWRISLLTACTGRVERGGLMNSHGENAYNA